MNFNEAKFLENVRKIHIKSEEMEIYRGILDKEIRNKLNEFVSYGDNTRFSVALDEICKNIVGRTMFKVLMTKMIAGNILKNRGKIRILEHAEDGSRYSPQSRDFAVKINFDRYEMDGSGKSDRQYYGINKEGNVEPKLKSLAGSMFHEFCHALHDTSGTNMEYDVYNLCVSDELREVWGHDEELRSICCIEDVEHGILDPICDHCFDLVRAIANGVNFLPRCSHNIGYRSGNPAKDAEKRQKLLKCFQESQKFMEGGLEYIS